MEYDDINFINRASQVVDKDEHHSNAEEGQNRRPSFDLVEHLGVQLGFDSLDEASVLLQHQSPREENWGSHFSREENGVLGIEAGSQNIEFSSTATQTCTISRHVNVWSEATSSESVQMLLNSVGQDEENLVEVPDTCESLQTSKNDKEFNVSNSESSPCNIEAVSDVECKAAFEKNQQGFENPVMDIRDDKQQLPISSEPSADNSFELQSVSDLDTRPTDESHLPIKEDDSEKNGAERESSALLGASIQDLNTISPATIESHRDIESHGPESQLNDDPLDGLIASHEIGSLTEAKIESYALLGASLLDVNARSPVIIDSRRNVEADYRQTQLKDHLTDFIALDETGSLTEMEDTRQGGINEHPRNMVMPDNDAGQYRTVTASSQETHANSGQTEFQPISNPIFGERNNDHAGKYVTDATQQEAVLPELQGPSTFSLDEKSNENTGNYASGKDIVLANLQAGSGSLVEEHIENNSYEDSPQVSQKSHKSIEAQRISESPLDKSTETTGVLHAVAPTGDLQVMPEFVLAKIKVEKTEQYVADISMEVDIQRTPEFVLDKSSDEKMQHHAADTLMEVDVQGMAETVSDEVSDKKAEQHAADTLMEVDVQGMAETVSDEVSDKKAEQHAADTLMEVDVQGMAETVSDEVSDKKAEQHAADTSMEVDIQGMAETVSDEVGDKKAEQHAADTLTEVDVQGMTETVSDEVSDKKAEQHAIDTLMEVNIQGMPEFVSDKINNEKTENHAADTSIELDVQVLQGFVSDEINEEKRDHVADTLNEVDTPAKIQDMPDPLQGRENNKVGDHADIKTVNRQDVGQLEQISDLMRGEISQDNAEKHATDVSCKDITVVQMQGIPDSSLEEGNEHGGGKHFIEATPKCLSQTCNDEQAKNGGEESVLGTKHLLETSVPIQEKTQEQKVNGPKTEEKGSDENLITTGSDGFTTVDVKSDNQVKNSEGVMISSGLDFSSIPASNALASHIDHTSSDLKLTIEKGSTLVMQHRGAETQVVESPIPVNFQDNQNQSALLVNPVEEPVHDVTANLGEKGSEKCLEANGDVTQNESVDAQGFGNQESHAHEKVSSVEACQDQQNERKDTSMRSVLPAKDIEILVKATPSPEGKNILSHTGNETDGGNFGAISLQGPNQSPMTGTSQPALQVNDSCITSESDYSKHADEMNLEFERSVKEDNTLVGIKMQDEGKTDTTFSSDGQQSMPMPDSGHSIHQTMVKVSQLDTPERNVICEAGKDEQEVHTTTIELPEKETKEHGKYEGKAKAMEVSLEVGISLEPDNKSPATDGDGNCFQSCLLLPNVDGPSTEKINFVQSLKLSSVSSERDDKVETLGTESGDVEGKSMSHIGDSFTFEIGTKNVPSGEGIYGSVDFPQSGEIDKNVGCWKPFQTSQPSENKASGACQTGKGEAEACQKHANDNVNSPVSDTSSILQKGSSKIAEAKVKPLPSGEKRTVFSGEKRSHANTVTELGKKSASHDKKSCDSQVVSLCTTATTCTASIRPGSHSSKIGARQELKPSRSDLPDIGPQFTSSCAMQLSALPDLNATVVPASVLFQQPFTDSQQVQLRAQILVYGSLIQGSLPDEALMITAFSDIGGASQNGTSVSDGGRSMWENAWHIAADRIHGKGFSNNSDIPVNTPCSSTTATVPSKIVETTKTPTPSASVNATDARNPVSGMRSADLAVSRSHLLPSRMTGAPNVGRAGSKNTPRAIMSPPRPLTLSSPVWSTPVNEGVQGSTIQRSLHPDPHQMTAARHLYQSLGHYPTPGSATPWMPHLSFPGQWVAPPQGPPPEPGLQVSSFAVPEVTQDALNNRRNSASSPVPYMPMTPVVPHFPSMVGPNTVHTGTNVGTDVPKAGVAVGRQSSREQKPRKRKKKSVSEEIVRTGGLQVTSSVPKNPAETTPVSSTGPSMIVPTTSNALIAPCTSISGTPSVSHYQVISKGETGQRIIFSEETATRIEQARLNAEDAASIAAAAVRHSQGIWSQLASQKNSGLISDCEAKLASAAVAAAAAASVAKAAAAAAKIACDAALQAKLMATEALSSDGKQDAIYSSEVGLLEGGQGHSHSIIATAREAAKKRVEAASAATKRAENLDAIVRAAELAAQAVSQAGAVVAMGDPVPLPLNVLLESGPEAYWKLVNQEVSIQKDENVHNETPTQQIVTKNEKIVKSYKSKDKRDVFKNETSRNIKEGLKGPATEMSKQVEKDRSQTLDCAPHDITTEKDVEVRKENQALRTNQVATAVSAAETVSRGEIAALETEPSSKIPKEAFASKANDIKEGSLVEVVSDEEGLRGVWFSAKVLSLKDGKAFVRYDELLSDEGPGQLQEWIPLKGDNGKAPRIRMAHPMTVIKFEGTRKRRRAAMGNYIWSAGDCVDAWIRDGWWEGIVRGVKDNDESKLIVHFPGEGDTSIIKAWNVRPSLIWKDGQWVEWTSLKAEKNAAHEVELPPEKRQKLDNHETGGDAKGKEKLQKVPNIEEAKKMQKIPNIEEAKKLQKIPNIEEAKKMQELNAVMSFSKDKFLAAAKSLTDDGSSASAKVNQIGLQTEGSKVVFGVPRHAKKRKFMDVSKHYVADTMVRNFPDGKSSGKIDIPKSSVFNSHSGWKAANKAEDKKSKKPMVSRPKDLKSGKYQDGQNKTKSEKDKSSFANLTKDISGQDFVLSAIPKPGSRRFGLGGNAPSIQRSGEIPHLSVSKETLIRRPSPSTKVKTSATESEQGSKGKQSSASDSSSLNVEKVTLPQEVTKDKVAGKATADMMEPRRSNRRIQPTSRLLEGLQSSPTVVKSSSSHLSVEKGGKTQSKTSFSRIAKD